MIVESLSRLINILNLCFTSCSSPFRDDIGSLLEVLVCVIEKIDGKVSMFHLLLPVLQGRSLPLGREPVVELCQPVLDGVDGDNAEDGPSHRVGQEHVDEGHELHGLAYKKNQNNTYANIIHSPFFYFT